MNISKSVVLLTGFLFLAQAVAETAPPPASAPAPNPWLPAGSAQTYQGPLFLPLPVPVPLPGLPPLPGAPQAAPTPPAKPYTMRRAITQQEKIQMMQMMLPFMTSFFRMSMADAMNYFARKYKAKEGLSFDDVRDSLFLRANQLNVKKVGENLMWKDFHVVLNDTTAPRIEVYSFCDIAVARELLQVSPEFLVFLPCRVAIMEDGDKNVWVMMLDWSLDWVKGYENQLGLTPALVKGAVDLNQRIDEMMRAAANGEL